jgi:hypothetical protein
MIPGLLLGAAGAGAAAVVHYGSELGLPLAAAAAGAVAGAAIGLIVAVVASGLRWLRRRATRARAGPPSDAR